MVDPENLLLPGKARQLPVQFVRRSQIMSKWFLHHDALPAMGCFFLKQSRPMDLLDYLPELAGQSGEIEKNVVTEELLAKGAKLLLELFVGRLIVNVALAIKNMLREIPPNFLIHWFGA